MYPDVGCYPWTGRRGGEDALGYWRWGRSKRSYVEMNKCPLVPFVVVFTKFDLIGSSSHIDYEERCRSLFGNVPTDIVSSIYSFVCVACKGCLTPLFPAQPKFRHLIKKLVATTDGVIIAHSPKIAASSEAQRTQPRMSLVPLAWSVSQRASRDINIQTAIEYVTSFLLMNFLIPCDRVGRSSE
jgi:hypothetical protein